MNIIFLLLGQKFLRFSFSNLAVATFFSQKKERASHHSVKAPFILLFVRKPSLFSYDAKTNTLFGQEGFGKKRKNEGNKFLLVPPYFFLEKERVLIVRPINKVCFPSFLPYKPNKRNEKFYPFSSLSSPLFFPLSLPFSPPFLLPKTVIT